MIDDSIFDLPRYKSIQLNEQLRTFLFTPVYIDDVARCRAFRLSRNNNQSIGMSPLFGNLDQNIETLHAIVE